MKALLELQQEGEEVHAELQEEVEALERILSRMETRTLLSGPHDETTPL